MVRRVLYVMGCAHYGSRVKPGMTTKRVMTMERAYQVCNCHPGLDPGSIMDEVHIIMCLRKFRGCKL